MTKIKWEEVPYKGFKIKNEGFEHSVLFLNELSKTLFEALNRKEKLRIVIEYDPEHEVNTSIKVEKPATSNLLSEKEL